MASVRKIASEAGVSTATVSRVMNNSPLVSETARSKVLRAIDSVGGAPRTARPSASNIAYLFTDSVTLSSPYDAGIMAGLGAGLERQQLDLLILNTASIRKQAQNLHAVLLAKGVAGVIIRTTAATRDVCLTVLQSGIPAVVLGDQIEGFEPLCIDFESGEASREAVEHLISLGHQRIAFCTNIIDDKDHQDRLAGYQRALDEGGLAQDARLLFRVPANRRGGEQLARRLASMSQERPTAIYLADPATSVGFMAEARRLGMSIPEDLSVVGFDDSEVRRTTAPELTAVCQNAELLGEHALHSLFVRIGRSTTPEDSVKRLGAWFEVNGTTGMPAVRGE